MGKSRTIFTHFTLFIALASLAVAIFYGVSPFRYYLLLCGLICLFVAHKNIFSPLLKSQYQTTFLPWVPWLFSLLIVCSVHNFFDFAFFLKNWAVFALLALTLFHGDFSRDRLVSALATCSLIISVACIVSITYYGLKTDIFNANKNAVIGTLTILNSCCLTYVLNNYQKTQPKRVYYFIFSVVMALVATIYAEVRSALLAYIALGLVFILFNRKNTKAIFILLGIFLLLIVLSLLTGRLQQGFQDLMKYQAGNANTSWGLRLEMWKMAVRAFEYSPLIGWGNDPALAMSKAGIVFPIKGWSVPRFHSDFFQLLSSGGVILTLGWITTVLLLIRNSLKDFMKLGALASLLAIGCVDTYWYSNSVSFMFCVLWALLSVTENRDKAYQ